MTTRAPATAGAGEHDDDGLGEVLGLTLGLGLGGLCILTIVGVCIYRARARNLAAAKAAKKTARTTGFAPGDPVRDQEIVRARHVAIRRASFVINGKLA